MIRTPVDVLEIDADHAVAVVPHDTGLSAVPVVAEDGQWHRASAGDGAAEALVRLLAAAPGRTVHGRFTVLSWAGPERPVGERAITVDQTNESVIVGDEAVVKWATHLESGPHPTARRLAALRRADFAATPPPWGLVTWQPDSGAETLVATVTGYLPGAVDGWTWAVDLFAAGAVADDPSAVVTACTTVGQAVADLHTALAETTTVSTRDDARRWRDSARDTLETARTLAGDTCAAVLAEHHDDIARILDTLGDLEGVPLIDTHGDLHVGQVLLSGNRFFITDFDGNPVLPPAERVRPAPAALDVAGMLQSLSHVAIVVAKYHDLDPAGLRRIDAAAQAAFHDAYTTRLAATGRADLFTADAVAAFRIQQVLREIIYAGRHLQRWMYVPDAALPALLKGDL